MLLTGEEKQTIEHGGMLLGFNFREITRKQASKAYNIMLDHSNSSKFVQTQNFPKCFNHVQELFFQIKTSNNQKTNPKLKSHNVHISYYCTKLKKQKKKNHFFHY